MRIKLTVAYDGTNYHGWQIQNNALSVEAVLTEAIHTLFHVDTKITGASRTDAGVHALGNVCCFDIDTRMEPSRIAFALNQKLPEDIRVQSSEAVSEAFNPRYDAIEKTYEYRIANRRIELPTQRLYSYFYHHSLDIDSMRLAAQHLIGEHDFTSFASIHAQSDTYVRTLTALEIEKESLQTIVIRVRGNSFLYNMVRIIAGTLIKVGCGAISPEEVKTILNAKDRSLAGPTAPACGLTLCSIRYK